MHSATRQDIFFLFSSSLKVFFMLKVNCIIVARQSVSLGPAGTKYSGTVQKNQSRSEEVNQ